VKVIPLTALIELHALSLERHGGAPGIRDMGALEGALGRAEHLVAYGDPPPSAIDVAVAVSVGLCRAHGFVDGNKRASAIALGVTLMLNGYFLDVAETEGERMFLSLAAGELSEDDFREWVRAYAIED
jgi:death-on-curing protein